jgi:glycosyltransferase involved in cell wall biosynthesis
MRVAVYTDYVYRRVGDVTYAERAFAVFLAALAPQVECLRLVGRLAPQGGPTRYALPAGVELAPLPHYASLADPVAALRSLVRSLGHMNRALRDVDVVWVLGPHPHAVVLALLAYMRRRRVVLGVRQDWPAYVRMRRPGKRWMHLSADVLEWIWRRLARRLPVVAVGPDLAANYAHAPAVLELMVSLVPAAAVGRPAAAGDYGGELRVLSVGRIDQEKNPLLLADVLASLHGQSPRWRLLVCGEGPLAEALSSRFAQLGLGDRAELLGYVAMGDPLLQLYRSCHALLHVSWTEGFPQVLIEAFATGLPVVATAVGGVAAAAGDAALLVPAGDAEAAAEALRRVADDPDLRARLTTAGLERARELTLEAQTARLAHFLEEEASPR